MATKTSQRVAIWIIAVVMAVGTLGAYFIVILSNDNSKRDQEALQQQLIEQQQEELVNDPTAYIVEEDVTELRVEDLTVGEGEAVKESDRVKVNYKGTLAKTGQKFDSSYDRGEPVTFGLSEVIAGWKEGLVGMKVGGKRRLIVPSEKAYGSEANSGIPANSDLVFEVELLEINPAE